MRSRWPAPCSIPRTAWPGWAFCAPRGAASRSTTCTGSPAPTIRNCSPVPCRSCSPSGFRCSAKPGRPAAERVLQALAAAAALRAAQPTASLGTWLEQVWLRLGGAACVDATARANLDLLWSCLDNLPGGEQDLLGPGLDAALDKLTALPDPAGQQRLRRAVDDHPQIQGAGVRGGHRARAAGRDRQRQAARCSPGWSAAWPARRTGRIGTRSPSF